MAGDSEQQNVNKENQPNSAEEKQELDNILGQITESSGSTKAESSAQTVDETATVAPDDSNEADGLEGILDRISEQPEAKKPKPVPKQGLFQRLLNFFKR